MGMHKKSSGVLENELRATNLFGILKNPMAYILFSALFIVSIFASQHAFAQKSGSSAALTAGASAKKNTPADKIDPISKEGIEELVSRVAVIKEKKAQLDNAWRTERNTYDSMKIRIDEGKKTIRLEMDEVLLNNSSRTRLDELLSQHEALSKDEKSAAEKITLLEEKVSTQQTLLIKASSELKRTRTLYAAQQREQDMHRVQDISRFLDRDLQFSEKVSFKCSTNKSLAACLNDYPLESRIQGWVQEHYQAVLSEELADKVDQVRLSSDWYSTETNRTFTDANISLDGSVTAEVEIRANVISRKMMACSLLKAPADLCEAQSTSLIVRSNKYGDQVSINNKSYGSTPLSVMLEPGTYNVEIKYQDLTQKRTLTLDDNRQLNFVF